MKNIILKFSVTLFTATLLVLGAPLFGTNLADAAEFQQLECQVMNPFAHRDYAIVSSIKVKRQESGKDWLLAHAKGLSSKALEGKIKQSDSWIYGAWNQGNTWMSLAKGKLNKMPKSKWIGAVVFKNRFDFEIACTQI